MPEETYRGFAPGRVNLIGEHTDYNGGMVLPAALSVGLEAVLTPRAGDTAKITADGFEGVATRRLAEAAGGHWSDAALGALREAKRLGLLAGGADLHIRSTIPAGSGLSSSAALIVAVLKAAREAARSGPDDVELALAARRVENDYLGVPCGIMDQMAVALAPPGHAMALDTGTLDYRLLPLPRGYAMAVVHSGVTRQLAEGRYAERKRQCDLAKAHFGTDDLCLLDPATIARVDLDETIRRRALHCATEHRRVVAAIGAIEKEDIAELGRLMIESHASMRDDFETSIPDIEALVESAVEFGAAGARLTGGGFGGCIVACVENAKLDIWRDALLARHPIARFIDAARR